MQKLNCDLQDHIRGFLSFSNVYHTRRVCKRWNDVANVPKSLFINLDDHQRSLPPLVDPQNVTTLRFWSNSNKCATSDAYILQSLLYQTHKSLRYLQISLPSFRGYKPIEPFDKIKLLEFPRVESLSLVGESGLAPKLFNRLLKSVPNVLHLEIQYPVKELDFAFLQNLKSIHFSEYPGNLDLKNESLASLTEVATDQRVLEYSNMFSFKHFPQLHIKGEIACNPYVKVDWSENCVVFEKIVWLDNKRAVDIKECGFDFAEVMTDAINDFSGNWPDESPLKFSTDLSVKDCHIIRFMMAMCGVFDEEELKNIFNAD